jgi:hypothetical protein
MKRIRREELVDDEPEHEVASIAYRVDVDERLTPLNVIQVNMEYWSRLRDKAMASLRKLLDHYEVSQRAEVDALLTEVGRLADKAQAAAIALAPYRAPRLSAQAVQTFDTSHENATDWFDRLLPLSDAPEDQARAAEAYQRLIRAGSQR